MGPCGALEHPRCRIHTYGAGRTRGVRAGTAAWSDPGTGNETTEWSRERSKRGPRRPGDSMQPAGQRPTQTAIANADRKATTMAASTRCTQATHRAPVTRPLPESSVGRASIAFSALLARTRATMASTIGTTNHARMAHTRAATAVPSVRGTRRGWAAGGSPWAGYARTCGRSAAGGAGGTGGDVGGAARDDAVGPGSEESGESVTRSFLLTVATW